MGHHTSISLMLFKPSHTYAALDLTTDSHYHEQEPQLPPRLSSFRITLPPGIINLKQMVVLLKIIESQGAPVWCGPGEVSCTSPCPGKAWPWDQTWLLKGLQSQGLKPWLETQTLCAPAPLLGCPHGKKTFQINSSFFKDFQNIVVLGKHSWQQKSKISPSPPKQITWSAKIHKANK